MMHLSVMRSGILELISTGYVINFQCSVFSMDQSSANISTWCFPQHRAGKCLNFFMRNVYLFIILVGCFFFFTITLSLNDNKTYLIKDHCIKWEKSNVIIYTSWLWVIICRNQSSFSFSLYSKELGEWNAFSFLFKNNFLDFTYLRNKTCEYVWSS